MSETPNTGIPYVPENTLDPAAGLNLALNVIDALLQTAVIDIGVNDPPGAPVDGDLYIVGAGTGAWAGQDENLARYVDEGAFWQFYEAGTQVHLVLNLTDGGLYKFEGTGGWVLAAGLSDAPSDGNLYARRDGAWASFVPGGGAAFAPVVTESGANLNASGANSGNYTRFTHAAPTYTFDDAQSYTTGDEYHGRYAGTGELTIVEAGSMIINPPANGSLIIPPGGTFTVKIVAAAAADLFGATEGDSGS